MKIVIAPDSFKDCLSAQNVALNIAKGIRSVLPQTQLVLCPLSDGGEGTVDNVAMATGALMQEVFVASPIGKRVTARYCILNKTAIIEMAEASGLERLTVEDRNPMNTHTVGTGELILHALDAGIRDFTITVGGSGTVDGGMGMAVALGYRFFDADDNELKPGGSALEQIVRIDDATIDSRLAESTFSVASDVKSPLLGPCGAAQMYGPQKGATTNMVHQLEAGLSNLQRLLLEKEMLQPQHVPGDGAAGGLAMGIRGFVGGRIVHGAKFVTRLVGLEAHLKGADWVITGEGKTDAQSSQGKICSYVGALAKKNGVSSILLSGTIDANALEVVEHFTIICQVSSPNEPVASAIQNAATNIEQKTEQIFRTIVFK